MWLSSLEFSINLSTRHSGQTDEMANFVCNAAIYPSGFDTRLPLSVIGCK
jgi:hypothetical protein